MASGNDDRNRSIEPHKGAPQDGYAQGEMGGAKSGPAAGSEGAEEASGEFGKPQSAGYGGYGGGNDRHGSGGVAPEPESGDAAAGSVPPAHK